MTTGAGKKVGPKDRLASFDAFICSTTNLDARRSEFDTYLEEHVLPRSSDFDILSWWKANSSKYPILQTIARDILVIPISIVASESAFSTSGRFIGPHRSRLYSKTLEAMMCAQDWLWAEMHGMKNLFTYVSYFLFFVLTIFILFVDSSSLASPYKRCATFAEDDDDDDDDDDDVQHLS